jgi:hypothetical protein
MSIAFSMSQILGDLGLDKTPHGCYLGHVAFCQSIYVLGSSYEGELEQILY